MTFNPIKIYQKSKKTEYVNWLDPIWFLSEGQTNPTRPIRNQTQTRSDMPDCQLYLPPKGWFWFQIFSASLGRIFLSFLRFYINFDTTFSVFIGSHVAAPLWCIRMTDRNRCLQSSYGSLHIQKNDCEASEEIVIQLKCSCHAFIIN
jgi:hypothetical protein